MNSKHEIIGEVVNELRKRRSEGVSPSQLIDDLQKSDVDPMDINKYFREAFALGVNVSMMPADMLDEHIGSQIDARRDQWQNSPPYPDLLRRRDREAFKAVARSSGNVIIVCAAGGSDLANGYQIHGVYKQQGGVNAWTGNEGEKIRGDLNRKMGGELIRFGPLDQSADRLALPDDDPRRAPRPPVLFFLPDGRVDVRITARSMEQLYRFLKIDWDQLYPGSAEQE